MKKIITVTESDLCRIVKRVINEQDIGNRHLNDPKTDQEKEGISYNDWTNKGVNDNKSRHWYDQLKKSGSLNHRSDFSNIDLKRYINDLKKEGYEVVSDLEEESNKIFEDIPFGNFKKKGGGYSFKVFDNKDRDTGYSVIMVKGTKGFIDGTFEINRQGEPNFDRSGGSETEKYILMRDKKVWMNYVKKLDDEWYDGLTPEEKKELNIK